MESQKREDNWAWIFFPTIVLDNKISKKNEMNSFPQKNIKKEKIQFR